MPVCALSQSCQVPAHLTRTSISAICYGPNWDDAFVEGRVVHKGELVPLGDGDFTLKAVIQDEDSSPYFASSSLPIRMTLMGALASDFFRRVNLGDMVVASGFVVFNSPTVKDKLHQCTLLLLGESPCIYVRRPVISSMVTRRRANGAAEAITEPQVNSVVTRKRASRTAQTSREPRTKKYSYCRLDKLEPGGTVNVYGVVIFFKPTTKSRGSDYCTILKIKDQSDHEISCNIFLRFLEDHPKIFKVGDIIRMHRVKMNPFNGSVSLISTHGFSVVTFDGREGEPIEPRGSGNYHFDADDRRMVEELRTWYAQQAKPCVDTLKTLSMVQPKEYFDLTCQLLAKAVIDSTCMLLRVWDGTQCPHQLLKVLVEPEATEGPTSFSPERESIIANVLVYDNHVETAQKLQPGAFLRIFNLRPISGSSRVPGLTGSQPVELNHLAFHLHGGTTYGRGIAVLPENSPDVRELKRVIETLIQEEEDAAMLELWGTPPESMDPLLVSTESVTERTCRHSVNPVTLSEVRRSDPGQIHHVRVQVKSYQPQRLHQSLKLFCDKCCSMQDVPDEEHVSAVFTEASRDSEPCSVPVWSICGSVQLSCDPAGDASLSLFYASRLMPAGESKQLLFVKGASLAQVKKLSSSFLNVIPVQSVGGQLAPLDLAAPVLFRGRRRFYGCKKCSKPAMKEPNLEGEDLVPEKLAAEALGVELMRYGLLLRLELCDSSGSLDVLLWRDSELFFNVSAGHAAANQEPQSHISQAMASLCPPEGSTELRPWLDLCLVSYEVKEDGGNNWTVYQICHTTLTPQPDTHDPHDP